MANQLIDFEQGSALTGDSGERADTAAIKPIVAGERAASTVIDRPIENLRARSEELRGVVEELLYRADADRWVIFGGTNAGAVGGIPFPTVAWDATAGTFIVSADIVVQPLLTPETDKIATKTYTFVDGLDTASFIFDSALFDYQNGNALRIIWEEAAAASITGVSAGYCMATLEGNPPHILRITVNNEIAPANQAQATHVNAALAAIPTLAGYFTYTYGPGSINSVPVALSAVPSGDEDYLLIGTYSREAHHIPAAQFAAYFGGASLALDGDALGIYYPYLTDPDPVTRGGRRQATVTTPSGGIGAPPNTDVTSSQLFQTSTASEKIPYAVPLCRRIGTYLVFVDGTVVGHGQTVQFGQSGLLLAALADQAGADAGNTLIGCDAVVDSPSSLAAGTLRAQIVEMLGHVNDRVVITDLAEDTGAADGATLVGAEAVTSHGVTLARGTISSQIDTLHSIATNAYPRDSQSAFLFGSWLFSEKLGGTIPGALMSRAPSRHLWGAYGGSFGKVTASRNTIVSSDPVSATVAAGWLESPEITYKRVIGVLTDVGGSVGGTSGGTFITYDAHDARVPGFPHPTGTLLEGLPATGGVTWRVGTACVYEEFLFVLFVGTGGLFRLQKYDITDPTLAPMWGTATNIPYACAINPDIFPDRGGSGVGQRIGPAYRMCAASSTRIALMVGSQSTAVGSILILNSSTGAIVGIGRGNAPSGATIYPMGGMVSDGTHIWYTYRTHAAQPITTTISIGCVTVTTPTVSPGGTPTILSASVSGSLGCVAMAYDGTNIWVHDGEITLQSYSIDDGGGGGVAGVDLISEYSIDTSTVLGAAVCISDLIYTGTKLYGLALIGDFKPALFSLDVNEWFNNVPKLYYLAKETEVAFPAKVVLPSNMGLLVFDADAVWAECALGTATADCTDMIRAFRQAAFR